MRIKVTGYVEADSLDPAHVDLSHPMGVSDDGYLALTGADGGGDGLSLSGLEDVEFELDG